MLQKTGHTETGCREQEETTQHWKLGVNEPSQPSEISREVSDLSHPMDMGHPRARLFADAKQ